MGEWVIDRRLSRQHGMVDAPSPGIDTAGRKRECKGGGQHEQVAEMSDGRRGRSCHPPVAHLAQDAHEETVVAETPITTSLCFYETLEGCVGSDVDFVFWRAATARSR